MSSLTEFLLARISEDEDLARRNSGDKGVGDTGFWPDYVTFDDGPDYPAAVAYLHEFNPARMLVECAAKRAIIALHHIQGYEDDDTNDVGLGCAECGHNEEYSDRGGWCDTVRLLAAVYADHPEYDPRWAQQ